MDAAVAGAAALVITLVATPIVRALAIRFGVVDAPGALKTQRAPVAYLGGVAVFAGLAAGPIAAGRPELLVPIAAALVLGVADDLRPLPPVARLAVEVAIGAAAAAVVPGDALVRVATAVLAVVLLNAVNLIDGQDGLAAGIAAVAALGAAALGGPATAVGLALAGAAIAFLVYNRPPASIYLGDGGAYCVGVALALLPSLAGSDLNPWSVWIATPLLVAVPLADTAIAVIRRFRSGRPLFTGDRSHVYDQLVDRGRTVPVSTATCIGAQILLTSAGVLGAHLPVGWAIGVATMGVVATAGTAVAGGFVLATKGAT